MRGEHLRCETRDNPCCVTCTDVVTFCALLFIVVDGLMVSSPVLQRSPAFCVRLGTKVRSLLFMSSLLAPMLLLVFGLFSTIIE